LSHESDGDVLYAYIADDGHPCVQCKREDRNLIASAPDLLEALEAAFEWIDAVPSDTQLPAMPGFDRDWTDNILAKARGETE
jgi:hypothetical protein